MAKPLAPTRPLADWALAGEACLLLGLARLAILALPFRWISAHLGAPNQESAAALAADHLAAAERIAWALTAAGRRTPWSSTCLARCLAGRLMLHRRGIASTLTLGVAPGETGGLGAHAWLRSGPLLVSGGEEAARFTAVACFRDDPTLEGPRP